MFVAVQASSMKTSLAGSRLGWASNHALALPQDVRAVLLDRVAGLFSS